MSGNYQPKILKLIAKQTFEPGEVTQIIVKHDDWCGIFKGKNCNCKPEVEMIREKRKLMH